MNIKSKVDLKIKMDRPYWKTRFVKYSDAVNSALDAYQHSLREVGNRLALTDRSQIVLLITGFDKTDDYWVNEAIRIWSKMKTGEDRINIDEFIAFLRG